jgi:hypothetical protein
MAERELTTKEQKFAKAVALGSSQCEAYSRVYSADASRATKRANGHNISKRPRVAKEIKRLRRLPAVDDYTTIKTKMIERLLEIAENDGSATARHRAIQTLLKYAEEGAERHVTSDPETDIAAIVKELTADVEAQVAIDRPSVAGEKNRRANQASATNQVITDEATTELADEKRVGPRYFEPLDRDSLDPIRAISRHGNEAVTLGIIGGSPETETNHSGQDEISLTEMEPGACSFEENPEKRPRYEWRAVPGRFPPIKRRVLVKTVAR